MLDLLGAILSSSAMLVGGLGFVVSLVLAFWLPYMAWSATKSLRGIRRELARLNEALESRSPSGRTGTFG